MAKTKKNIAHINARFIQLSKFVEDPTILVEKNKELVRFGEDNRLPYQLIEYYNNVGINRAIIDKKAKMFMGNGVSFNYTDEKTATATTNFLAKINRYENANELFEKIKIDIFLFGGVYLQIIWEKGGKKIKEILHQTYSQVRSFTKDEFGNVNYFAVNTSEEKQDEWRKFSNTKAKNIKIVPAFNISENKDETQIFYYKPFEPGAKDYYAFPDYIAAMKDLDTLQALSDFNNSALHNGLQPGFTILFKGPEPSPEAQDDIVAEFRSKYQDTENANKPMFLFLGEDLEVQMEVVDTSDIGSMYTLLEESVISNISVAHQVPRIAANLTTPGSLGSSKEYYDAYEIIRSSYIAPIQSSFLASFNKLMQINGLDEVILESPRPNLTQYSISELMLIFTRDEVREILGAEPTVEIIKKEEIKEDINE